MILRAGTPMAIISSDASNSCSIKSEWSWNISMPRHIMLKAYMQPYFSASIMRFLLRAP